jgi:hypothetical protein
MWPRADTGQLDDTQSLQWTRHAYRPSPVVDRRHSLLV